MSRPRLVIPLVILFVLGVVFLAAFDVRKRLLEARMIGAMRRNDASAVASLLRSWPSPANVTDEVGNTPIAWSAAAGRTDLVKLCLDKGARPNVTGPEGDAPLHCAARKHLNEMAETLLRAGADVNAKTVTPDDPQLRGPFRKAFSGLFDILAGDTPLHLAVQSDADNALIGLLLSKGASVNAVNGAGSAPLHTAVLRRNPRTVKLLLDAGADVNLKDGNGRKPLMLAKPTPEQQAEIARLQKRLKPVDDPAQRAIKERLEALTRGRDEVIDLLRKHGATE